ncbi:MAG: ATP-binding protein [Proteobacteria bacterium]|nr:ATP-binding protein [Pseudomonadota bacterium]MBU1060494.1 ATP-binding protein [Pseudomonadota bacterium]
MRTKEELFAEKLSLESRLHQTEKLGSVGRLAAGIAHEINTPTRYVRSNIDFLHEASKEINTLWGQLSKLIATAHKDKKLEDDFANTAKNYFETADWEFLQEEIPKALVQSQEGLRRITKIVTAMKNFSHPGIGNLEPSNINLGIQSTLTLATNEWKYSAEMELQLEDTLPLVPCYPDELNQVFLTMIINSAHAIAESTHNKPEGKGLITIVTQKIGAYVQIDISDSGAGMSAEVVEKIFEPFYTTKEVGKGTGQGLAIAHDVLVNKHHGSIDVQTKLGQGTTFLIKLAITQPS